VLAIRIANPLDFKNIANAKLTQIPWDKIAGPLDLLPQEDKSWIGRFSASDGRTGDLKLVPASAATRPATQPGS
jgi:hypothetical protein